MRKQLVALVIAGTAAAGLVGAPSAQADDTATTFTLTAGSLAVSSPVSKDLASAAAGSASLSATLGTVTVSDGRGALGGSWTASAVSTDFAIGATPTADEIIPKANVSYTAPVPTLVSGTAVPVSAGAKTLSASTAVVTATLTVGNNVVSWDPTITITLPSDAIAGAYAGTITHSIA